MKDLEKRFTRFKFETREEGDDTIIFEGIAAPYGERAPIPNRENVWFTEEYVRGAFSKAIREKDDAVLNIDHGGLPLARVSSGTLRLSDTERGLHCRAELDKEDPDVMRVLRKIERGDLREMSCAFVANRTVWDESEEVPHRAIEEVRLYDVSIVTNGAYSSTDVSLSSRDSKILERMQSKLDRQIDLRTRAHNQWEMQHNTPILE